MIKQLHIKNFKAHTDSIIRFEKLTVLTGINGSGKTAITQALLLLRQSYLNNRLAAGLDLNKPLCSIGIGQDALSRMSANGEISFSLTRDNGKTHRFVFDAGSGLNDSFIKRSIGQTDYPELAEIEDISLFNKKFQYISASRWGGKSIFPKDTYSVVEQQQISINEGQGELVAHFLNHYGINDIQDFCDGNLKDLSLKAQTVYWERQISPNVTIEAQPTATNSNSFVINYGFDPIEPDGKALEGLKAENIGFGISYVLPVIVALLSATPGSLIIIENPEAHLHPSGQAQLTKLIAKVAATGVQVLIETHSDHVITGIQLACKEFQDNQNSGISPNDVIINYISTGPKFSAVAKEIPVNRNGTIDFNEPGFFEQAEIDFRKLYDQD